MNSKRETHQLLNDNPVEHGEEEPQMVNELEVSTGNLTSTDVVMEGMLTQQESNDDHIVMAMFPAQAVNPETGESVVINVYLDSGAKRTCIDAQAAKQLNLRAKQELVLETSRFNTKKKENVNAELVELVLKGKDGYTLPMKAFSVTQLAPPMTIKPMRCSRQVWEAIERHNPVNKPSNHKESRPIHLLVGLDYWYTIMGLNVSTTPLCEGQQLVIHHTPLGNVLCGRLTNDNGEKNERSETMMADIQREPTSDSGGVKPTLNVEQLICNVDYTSNEMMQRIWGLDGIGTNEPKLSGETDNFPNVKPESISYQGKRYSIGFPWKDDPRISTNFGVAKGRLTSTLRALCPEGKCTAKFEKYNTVIQSQLKAGVVEPVHNGFDVPSRDDVVHYLPHFAVTRDDKETTKVRVVYDASTKTKKENVCLNDLMHTGPNLLNNMTGMLLRFRLPRIAMVSDIEKAFLQVGLHERDRDATRFLWLKDPTKPVVDDNLRLLRFTRIPFGVVASPYLLGVTIRNHLAKYPGATSDQIRDNIYVDNVIMGADDTHGALQRYVKAKSIFNDASMNLREWMSNDGQFMQNVTEEDRAAGETANVLGLQWNARTDTLGPKEIPPMDQKTPCTKRTAVQHLAKVFDPTGFINPVTIKGKILLQFMWKNEFQWDTPLPEKIARQWRQFELNLHEVSKFSTTRRCIETDTPIRLLCFVDASQEAFSANVYAYQATALGVSCHLVFSKAKVAPVNQKLTLPRLELNAAVLGANAMRFVSSELNHPVNGMSLWSDSQIVLHWLYSKKTLPAYVSRRKEKILNGKPIDLGYVPSNENPADLSTRGLSARAFSQTAGQWFNGPNWITESDPSQWPKFEPSTAAGPETEEVCAEPQMVHLNQQMGQSNERRPSNPFGIDPLRYSKLSRLLRVTA